MAGMEGVCGGAMRYFDKEWLKKHPGAILHVRSSTRYGKLIRRVLGSWGNHDAMNVLDYTDRVVIGESIHPVSKHTDYSVYEMRMNVGAIDVKVLLPHDYDRHTGMWAASYWNREIKNSPYDWLGPILIGFYSLSVLVRLLWKKDIHVGHEWANWCTEGLHESYFYGPPGGKNYWRKKNPTPRTTENRLEDGIFVDVTADAIMVA